MANNYPFEMWYWDDWRSDTAFLSYKAKAVWFEVLGLMWVRGRLSRITQTIDDFVRATGIPKDVFIEGATELQRDCNARVSCDGSVATFYSQHRERENEKRELTNARSRKKRSLDSKKKDVQRDCNADATGYSHSHSHSHSQMSLPSGEPMGAPACVKPMARSVQGQSLSLPRTPKDVKDAAALSGKLMSEEQATSFFEYYEARGWVIPNSGPVVRWQSLIDGWMRREQRGYSNANASRALEPRASACGDPRNTADDFADYPC